MKRLPAVLLVLFTLPVHAPAFDREVWSSYPAMNDVTALAEGDLHIYVGTTGGIRRYDRYARRWLAPLTVLDGLPDNRISALAYDPQTADLWIDTPSGAVRWLTRLETLSLFSGDRPGRRPPDPIPHVSLPFGYYLESGWIRGPRRAYDITDVLIDSWRILWIGTFGLGVARADLHDRQLEFHRFGPLGQTVTALARDGEGVWFGGWDSPRGRARGITRYRPGSETWDYFEAEQVFGLDDARVSVILPDSADVWFGTPQGLVRYRRGSGRWTTYRVSRSREGVTALARDGARLWIGTPQGLAVLDPETDTIRVVQGSERFEIRALSAGADYLWAGTDAGLFRCPRNDVTWAPAEGPDSLTRSPINGLFARKGGVWATVERPSALIHLAPADSAWQRFPLSEVGGTRRIAIAADTSRVWLGTDLGAFRFDIRRRLWKRYTQSDGLIHSRVHAVLLDGDYVWFGTEAGASRYHWALDFFEQNR